MQTSNECWVCTDYHEGISNEEDIECSHVFGFKPVQLMTQNI